MTRKPLMAALLSVGLIAGCGDSAEDKALADVCSARTDIAKQVDGLKGLTLTSASTAQISDMLGAIRDDLSQISGARDQLSEGRRGEVDDANEAFAATVRETASTVVTTTSIDDAKAELDSAFGELAAAYRSSYAKIDCP